jgi:hypothetical protein
MGYTNSNMKKQTMGYLLIGVALLLLGYLIYLLTIETPLRSLPDPIPVDQAIFEPIPKEDIELPFGGTKLFPDNRLVALYGSPQHSGLGAMGEQDLADAIVRAKVQAQQYETYSEEPIMPTFEIITTIASAGPSENNDYSQELSIEKIRPWVDAALENDMYVVLDLQPGRSTFLTQAKIYEELLKEPHVGLALDPEWRLQKESDRHLVKVGSVSAAEINETSEWLADLTAKHELPQKLLIIHQFKLTMITDRETLVSNREELAYMIHMDGHGAPESKTNTWNTLKETLDPAVYLGWKNFYDEDKPTMTPEQTMAQDPKPWFVSYQ